MAGAALQEQLRRARAEHGEDLASLSARTGLRIHHVRAIEAGRFGDLPAGIYGRAAVRSLASAYGLDPEAALASCDPLLPRVADPLDALARVRGVARTPDRIPAAPAAARLVPHVRLRPFAAAALDGIVTGALLVAITAGAALLARAPIAALRSSAVALAVVGLILDVLYYVWLGGVVGTTFGEFTIGPDPLPRDPRPLTLRAIARRTLATATADARALLVVGIWIGRLTRVRAGRTAPTPAPSPSPPQPPGREEVLTWSMNRQACVPPLPLRRQRG